ncbi:MarR family winged helix-turn-helix transcriptional regulator [Saccharospirillum salsuginis]|uniref:MarR family transcriptional regulator n=1 Tax=Saccharospirillum salsuginis TaxID=418750 RepID=A0A918KDP7_9GAMM|nr:MarR family transcriptional regulator [Saccharospirillum salsuginis]GGX58248.1 MarR family transcriptional regulator [Saccharospirillum salsuginis]
MVELNRRESLGWHVAVLARKMAARLDSELKKYDLKISYWPTLFLLWEQEGLSQTELAKACMTEHYTTTRILDKLEILGLIERRTDPNSRRTFRIYLTEKGRALEKPLTDLARRVNDHYLSRLPKENQDAFIGMMQDINEAD